METVGIVGTEFTITVVADACWVSTPSVIVAVPPPPYLVLQTDCSMSPHCQKPFDHSLSKQPIQKVLEDLDQ